MADTVSLASDASDSSTASLASSTMSLPSDDDPAQDPPHLFVIHSDLRCVMCDAFLVPTSAENTHSTLIPYWTKPLMERIASDGFKLAWTGLDERYGIHAATNVPVGLPVPILLNTLFSWAFNKTALAAATDMMRAWVGHAARFLTSTNRPPNNRYVPSVCSEHKRDAQVGCRRAKYLLAVPVICTGGASMGNMSGPLLWGFIRCSKCSCERGGVCDEDYACGHDRMC
jgi:hypothetical protein